MSLNYYAPRSCHEFVKGAAGRDVQQTGELSSYRDCPAYVLLGQPGSGKTTAFEEEAKQPGCEYVSARDFITFDVKPDWRDKTLFIDGLDEVRAGKDDVLSPFDKIREKLAQYEQPGFRLSCRAADWYGASDREGLAKVSPQQPRELFLDELTDGDLQQILIENHHKTEPDASSFLQEAQRRGLIELIKNPQILAMLVVAVGEGNEWPETKVDVFRLACEKLLLEEWNQTHNIAHRHQTPPSEELMQASGMLCAVMLLARKDGFVLSRSDQSENYPFIADMATEYVEHLHLVSRTRLFTIHEGHAEYSHRIFAEYLSAYYLSEKVITGELTIGRLLALMTGTDGGVVAELRGVYAWLATLCHTERTMLMKRDPLGVVLYGDVSLFSREERLQLLHELSNHAERTGDTGIDYRNTQPFGAFCQSDMEQAYLSILASRDRGDAHQYLLAYVLASMTHGKALPGLSDALTGLLKEPDYQPRNRRQALKVLVRSNDQQALQKILQDVWQNIISDPDNELLGQLLLSRYPDRVPPDEIFNYFRAPKRSGYFGTYDYFWSDKLTRLSTDAQVAQLLDALVTTRTRWGRAPDGSTYQTMVGNLLVRGVEAYGASVETVRLLGWLGLGLDEYGSILLLPKEAERIRKWLEQHPEIQKSLIERRLEQCSRSDNFHWCVFRISEWLFNSELPEDYGRWCLDKVRTTKSEQVAKYLFRQSVDSLNTGKGNAGMSLELIEDAAANDNDLKRHWDEYRVSDIKPEGSYHKQRIERVREEQDQEKKAFVQFIRNNLREIEAGTAKPGIFSKLASAYYGYFIESRGDNPSERLRCFFDNDIDLVQAISNGLRRFVQREDIPEVTEILQARMENKLFVYSHPYRAGIDELAETGGEQALELGEDKIEKALAFYYVDGIGEEPIWYETLLNKQPELVARVYTMYGAMALRAGKTHIAGSYQLAFGKSHQQVARFAALPLLESFRTRSTSKQVEPLKQLLIAALLHADHLLLKRLIEKKLCLKSMDAAQRVLWLTAGLILDPEQFSQQLTEFVSRKEARVNYLSGFLSYERHQWSPLDNLTLRASASLVRLLGPYYAPVAITDDDYLSGSASSASSEVIIELISRLAIFLTDEATATIENLLESDQLTIWHRLLHKTLYAQRSAKREARFRHASLEQVRDALKNGPPANVADLACITRERIQELAKRIKYGNTNDFRQYWKDCPSTRQHEETCRDRFLSDLKPLLANMEIDAQPEGRYAVDRRADIRASFGGTAGYNVPIEIKCNDSRDLWHGIRKQLIERYTIDPGAHGYGIYLVFWFGYEKTTPHPESGPKPGTPEALEERLSRLLRNDEERKKVAVCVVDCTAGKEPE